MSAAAPFLLRAPAPRASAPGGDVLWDFLPEALMLQIASTVAPPQPGEAIQGKRFLFRSTIGQSIEECCEDCSNNLSHWARRASRASLRPLVCGPEGFDTHRLGPDGREDRFPRRQDRENGRSSQFGYYCHRRAEDSDQQECRTSRSNRVRATLRERMRVGGESATLSPRVRRGCGLPRGCPLHGFASGRTWSPHLALSGIKLQFTDGYLLWVRANLQGCGAPFRYRVEVRGRRFPSDWPSLQSCDE